MRLARKIISIIEGFKLGSLGVSKPVSTNKALAALKLPSKKKVWGLKVTSKDTTWMEYFKPEWGQVLEVPDTLTDKIVIAQLSEMTFGNVFTILQIAVYEGDEDNIGKSLGTHKFTESGGIAYQDVSNCRKWRNTLTSSIETDGLEAINFPQKWKDAFVSKPTPPAPPLSSTGGTGKIISVTSPSGRRLTVHNASLSTDPHFLHSKKRVTDLTPQKLLTRLKRITDEQKLLDTALALQISTDPSKQAIAKDYFDTLEKRFGYTIQR